MTANKLMPLLRTGFFLLACSTGVVVNAEDYSVSPDGSPYTIQQAVDLAMPGDTITLSDGSYTESIVTVRDGEEDRPITIKGGNGAIVHGDNDDKIVTVLHSWVSLEGFTVDGEQSSDDSSSSYADKCVYVWGQEEPKEVAFSGGEALASLIGFSMQGLIVKNCGGECVRLKNFVTNSRVTDNTITTCGVYDFRYGGGGKNGEAVYVGTSSNQWSDGPDMTANNVVSGNTMTPNGNECVDIKEGAYGNIIENNTCREQLDDDSGCYSSRGDGNTFRYNTGDTCDGAGVRLGGWEVDGEEYGKNCNVYGNEFTNTGSGLLVKSELPQGSVCGNTCSDGSCGVMGGDEVVASWDQPCSGEEEQQEEDIDSDGESNEGGDGEESVGEDEVTTTDEFMDTVADDGTDTITTADGDSNEETADEYSATEESTGIVPLADENTSEDGEGEGEAGGEGEEQVESTSSGCRPVQILAQYLTGGPSTQQDNPVEHVLDGLLDTRWSAEGPGSWMSIDLPEATPLSGLEASFEDGDGRTQYFDIVVLTETEVHTSVHSSSGATNEGQLFSFDGDVLAKSVFIVGYGNSLTAWNSFTAINLCEGGGDDRRGRRQLTDTPKGPITTTAASLAGPGQQRQDNIQEGKKNLRGSNRA